MTEPNQWAYVIAAYALTAAATTALLVASWHAMRTSERRAADLSQDEQP